VYPAYGFGLGPTARMWQQLSNLGPQPVACRHSGRDFRTTSYRLDFRGTGGVHSGRSARSQLSLRFDEFGFAGDECNFFPLGKLPTESLWDRFPLPICRVNSVLTAGGLRLIVEMMIDGGSRFFHREHLNCLEE